MRGRARGIPLARAYGRGRRTSWASRSPSWVCVAGRAVHTCQTCADGAKQLPTPDAVTWRYPFQARPSWPAIPPRVARSSSTLADAQKVAPSGRPLAAQCAASLLPGAWRRCSPWRLASSSRPGSTTIAARSSSSPGPLHRLRRTAIAARSGSGPGPGRRVARRAQSCGTCDLRCSGGHGRRASPMARCCL